jgi:hypothetical protein
MESKGYGIAWILNTKEWKKARERYSISLASLQRNAVNQTHQENYEEDVKQKAKAEAQDVLSPKEGNHQGHTHEQVAKEII